MAYLKTLRLPVALAAALAAQPLAAADVEKLPTLEQTARDVKELKEANEKSFKALMDQLKRMDERLNVIDGVRKDVDALQIKVRNLDMELALSNNKRLEDLAELRTQVKQAREQLETAKAKIGSLETEVAKQNAVCDGLQAELAQVKKAGSSRPSASITEGTGTIRLFNTYGFPVKVRVNTRVYELDPGESYVLASQPVGTFTFEVLGLTPPTTRALTADRPYDLEVYDLARGPLKTSRLPR